ncbi:MAG: helix-turn-helix domain-containing protein, partial [Bacillus sp. (in: firmicutes)]
AAKADKTQTNPPVQKTPLPIFSLKETLAHAEKEAILNTLEVTNGNKQEAAKLLGIGKTSLYEKCKLYTIK